jgi:hypothetical protein
MKWIRKLSLMASTAVVFALVSVLNPAPAKALPACMLPGQCDPCPSTTCYGGNTCPFAYQTCLPQGDWCVRTCYYYITNCIPGCS